MKRVLSLISVLFVCAALFIGCGGTEIETKQDTTIGGSEIISNDGASMVLVPAGEFQMGDKDDNEKLWIMHTIYLDAFYMDVCEVTNAQYKKFIYATNRETPEFYWGDSDFNAPDQPVVGVSWFDAVAYAEWAGKRLPTEAEWEKAARGGLVGKEYPRGDTLAYDEARYSLPGGILLGDTPWYFTSPVGSFAPNGYGLYDMAGNVWEWCSDWYDDNYYVNSPKSNPVGPSSGQCRVLRGGSWFNSVGLLRVAYRHSLVPTESNDLTGFRCAQDAFR
jgi:iron(II)-dependent oxidoreductase